MDVTYHSKPVICPLLNKKVTITAKYKYSNDFTKELFLSSECEVVKNSMLKPYEQNPDIKYLKCPSSNGCDLLSQFEKVVAVK
jgi:hypothetical protein